ncbi:MAG TPA: tetratricopeptide repeat protein, partial [Pyrinomonadaceae bacterium]|nr:tetratricopeptide repeat protein [Pyrinomonadaceae bacterium]
MSKEKQTPDNTVVDLTRARVRLRSRAAKASSGSLADELDAISLLLDRGHSVEAKSRLALVISAARNEPVTLARARLALSYALEMHGSHAESLEAVAMYESEAARAALPPDLALKIKVQMSIAINYAGDHPKAIVLLKTALRDLPEENAGASAGDIYAGLARVYRSITEYPIARDYSEKAREIYRQSGDWRGLAEAYFGIALAYNNEGKYESALENLEQAAKLVGDRPSTFFLGKIYSNIAGAFWFLKRPQEGIRHLEKAIGYYERTEHTSLAAEGYNNLGNNLILIGQWDRAQEMLERALAGATEVDETHGRVAMILDSLGDLSLLKGNLDEAYGYLERAVKVATEDGNRWYACQAFRTLARYYLAMDRNADALATAQRALEIAKTIGDVRATCESELLLSESYLRQGNPDLCVEELQKVA